MRQSPRRTLPPKYFEDPNDPKFDSIRPKLWFNFVYDRQEMHAKTERAIAATMGGKVPIKHACNMVGLDPSYVSSFRLWEAKEPFHTFYTNAAEYQAALDDAYENYCDNDANFGFRDFLKKLAPFYKGVTFDPLNRMWEFDFHFYPTGYEKVKA